MRRGDQCPCILLVEDYWVVSSLCVFRYAVLAVLWAILLLMVYKVLSTDKDYTEYDPFEILELDPVQQTACDYHLPMTFYIVGSFYVRD